MYNKILLSVDDSDFARKAALKTLKLAELSNAEISVVNVVVPIGGVAHYERIFTMVPQANEVYDDIGRAVLEDMKEIFGDYEKADYILLHGDPATEIIEIAKNGYDLLVIGARGSSRKGLFSMGSVVSKVIFHTDISVLVVR
jgi:nucleotide-binding universal stress UspA family protein